MPLFILIDDAIGDQVLINLDQVLKIDYLQDDDDRFSIYFHFANEEISGHNFRNLQQGEAVLLKIYNLLLREDTDLTIKK